MDDIKLDISDLRVGQPLWLGRQRCFDFAGKVKVEAVGYDWAVVRDENKDLPLLLEKEDYFCNYIGQDEEER